MDPVDALHRLGGVATYAALARLSTRGDIDARRRAGAIVRDARARYSLPEVGDALRAANATTGIVSHLSAALHWGWAVKTVPAHPNVTVPRNRNLAASARAGIEPHWATLEADEVTDQVTSRSRTLIDCLRTLPFDEALAVADSALRSGDVSTAGLRALTGALCGPGSGSARRVGRFADAAAANPFESVLRAISLDVPGLALRAQVRISDRGFFARPDLVDDALRLVAEADSQTWHNASRAQLRRDCRRYTGLTARGWLVARFAWEDVMYEPSYVRAELELLAACAHERA